MAPPTHNYTVMTHTQVNFSASIRPEIGVVLLELGVGLVSRVSLVSHMVSHDVHAGVNCVCNVYGSAHSCGCVVNGTFAGVYTTVYLDWLLYQWVTCPSM